ncbi:MAG: SpoIIE family protein phosphatase [Streptosporangiaceae bacterium]
MTPDIFLTRSGPVQARDDLLSLVVNHNNGQLRGLVDRRAVGPMDGTEGLESLFPGPSAMAALMRERDWRQSPLGPPAGWPSSLQTAYRICLTSRFPMIVWWGPDLRFIYNDAYLPLLGTKHPALDIPGADVWHEIWHIIGPMLRGVLETGLPTWSEDLLLPMNRHGYWEETYWTYSYSPLHDDAGAVRGVFTAVTDTTDGIDGLALAQELRGDPRTAAIPLLLLSARAGQEAAIEGLNAGADDYLIKPFAAEELLARVRANVELTRLRSQQARWRAALTESLQEGFFIVDPDGRLMETNQAFRDILGYGAEPAADGHPPPWWPDEAADLDGYRRVAEAFASAQSLDKGRFVLPLRHRDGHRIWAAATFSAVEDPEGRGRMLVGTLRDITAERLAAHREAAVSALSVRLSQSATLQEVLDTGVAELRRQWNAARVLAATWERGNPVALTSTSASLDWDDLQPQLREAIEALRAQPLHVSMAAGADGDRPAGAGTAVEYSGGMAAIWIDLDGTQRFGLEDRTLLALLGGSLGQALNRARLLDQQREVGLALQHAILGPGWMPPGFAVRYEPATPPLEVGGDWYDIAELAGNRIGIIVGDCVGRGLPAASVMGQLRSACRALLLQSAGPAQALTALDRFAEFIPDALCSTVFCGVLDTATGRLTYCSAGHPPGILAHPGGRVELLDQGRSLPLALSPTHPRREATTHIPLGARLLLYTDGLVERRRRPIDAGTAQLSALLRRAARDLPVDDLAGQIMTGLIPDQGYEDDVAVLLYHRVAPLELAFRADPGELTAVRRQLRSWLRQLSLGTMLAQDVLIAACEACANAIEHGYRDSPGGIVRLKVEVTGPDLRITVTDSGSWRPPRRVPYRGNGLNLIRATMQHVEISAGDSGTTVAMRARSLPSALASAPRPSGR